MILHNLQAEQQLCLILARKSLSLELADRAKSLVRKGLKWDEFLDLSVKHRVFPLIFRHLGRFEPGLVPARILNLFRALYLANCRKNEIFAEELARIVKALGRARIPALPFKGPVLGNLLWRDHRLWVGQDLDLLVRQKDLRRAEEMVRANGYRNVKGSEMEWSHLALQAREKPWVMLGKQNANITVVLDLQTSLFPWWMSKGGLDEQVWKDIRRGSIFGVPGLLLSPDWNFILLSLHAYKHLFVLLKWVSELHELWNSPATDRDMILGKSEEVGLKSEVLLSIAVCERLLGKGSKVSPCVNGALAKRLSGNVFRGALSPVSTQLVRLQLPGSMIGKIRYLATMLFASTINEQRLLRLPRCLHFFYYLIRPVRLVLTYSPRRPLPPRQKL